MEFWGDNLQNLEKSLREIFIPDGYSDDIYIKCLYWIKTGDHSIFKEEELAKLRVFLQVDQAGAEALILAYDCDPGDYRELFRQKIKVHSYVALKLFKDVWKTRCRQAGSISVDIDTLVSTPIHLLKSNPEWKELDSVIRESDNWPADQRYYYFAKQTCHSANYDIQKDTFRFNVLEKSDGKVVLSREDAEYFLTTYRNILFPEISARIKRVREQVKATKLLYNFFGFPYQITSHNITETDYKKYYAWSPQSTVGEITRIALTRLYYFIKDNKRSWDILADTHDSYLLQVPIPEVREASQKMQEFINIPFVSPIDGEKFSMRSECQCGFNWAPFKKDKNELGLQELKWL